jgi:short-subunit dehydrogenase
VKSIHNYGKIINISSIGGIMGLPYQGFYSASKFAIEGYSEALAAEVKGFGIKVILVEPGDFSTNFTANRKKSFLTLQNNNYKESFLRSLKIIEKEENRGLKPIILAKKIEKIIKLKNPRFRYVVANLEQKLSVILKRIIPGNLFINILRDYYKV